MTRWDERSDAELLKLAADADEEAFVEIYRRRHGSLYRFALHMSGSATVAEDVTQEVFLTLLGKFSEYDVARGTLAGYLLGIARKQLMRHFEHAPIQLPLAEESGSDFAATPEPLIERGDPQRHLDRAESIASVRRAILSLPTRYREAIVLCELDELSYEDAAAIAGCSVGTIRSRLHRGRALLAKKIRQPTEIQEAASRAKTKGCIA